jgi:hypothetical protein
VCLPTTHYCLGGGLLGSIKVWYGFTGDIGPMQPLREAMDSIEECLRAPHPPGGAKFFQKICSASPLISCLSFLAMPANDLSAAYQAYWRANTPYE